MDALETIKAFEARKVARLRREADARRTHFEAQLPALIAGVLRAVPETEKIVLFGSLSRKNEKNVRDIDLALSCPRFYRAAAWLLGRNLPVDVVDLDDVYPHIKARILSEGIILYEKG